MPHAAIHDFDCHFQFDDFGQEEVLVLSHSLGTNLSIWEEQVDLLRHHFNVLRYDIRGHGSSGTTQNPFDVAALALDVIALLDHLKLDQPVTFCGLSLGGLIGQWLGTRQPHRLKKMILSNTAAKIGDAALWNQRIETVTREGLSGIRESAAARWFTDPFRKSQPQTVASALSGMLHADPRGYAQCCAAIRDADFRDQLRQLTAPTLVISGDMDPVTTTADAGFMAKRIPNARHATLRAAHLSNIEKPQEFAKFILFFAEQ